ncbi:hypothetical protein PZ938_03780 [Luteipulveratus sp. YIM 133132]|uniref:hypothetical protein n=1 Tax=Luteipulveratus flavus TaxID=3031728 RepID=UPI0023B16EB0|nr:hypothetical protein [Luteipulveratus sp. YIM 133132]MDE9364713.1 hypothetical protein [Luteipulveratus sp. YIM 133132]
MRLTTRPRRRTTVTAVVAAMAIFGLTAPAVLAVAEPGTPAKDVHIGLDNDNAANTFVQPPGVTAKQHMDSTDVLLGRGNDDLLIGNLGGDTLLGGTGDDIEIGGPENFAAPNSDVIVGDRGNDINIWAPGDGSDAFLGQEGFDTMVFAPFQKNADGSLKLERRLHRTVPRVDIGGKAPFSCDIVRVPKEQRLGFQFLVRFNVNGVPAVTVRQKDVERVFCPSPETGMARVADLTTRYPSFRTVPLNRVGGVTGAILAPAG